MEEGISVSEGKNIDIKQEKQDNVDNFKCEFDSGSQDSSKSGSGGYQRWAPNLNGIRKSAFTPYKSVQCTALTNLQRGDGCLLPNSLFVCERGERVMIYGVSIILCEESD